MADTDTIQSVETSFEIVETLREMNGAGVSEVADHLDLSAGTVHNHLRTLAERGYVVQDEQTYRIGLRFIHLGDHAKHRVELHQIGQSNIDELAQQTGEMANLLVEENGRGIYVAVSRSDTSLQLTSYVREREYLHCTALGKAILANVSQQRVERIIGRHGLPKMTDSTITDCEELFESLESIQEQGYVLDDEERLNGLRCVAAPVELKDGSYGAVSVSGPTSRIQDQRFREELPSVVRDTANAIEIDMVHS